MDIKVEVEVVGYVEPVRALDYFDPDTKKYKTRPLFYNNPTSKWVTVDERYNLRPISSAGVCDVNFTAISHLRYLQKKWLLWKDEKLTYEMLSSMVAEHRILKLVLLVLNGNDSLYFYTDGSYILHYDNTGESQMEMGSYCTKDKGFLFCPPDDRVTWLVRTTLQEQHPEVCTEGVLMPSRGFYVDLRTW
jgi:hypothetical protein|uniref:Uncharacterized protein n=1 Tax=Siphoviridae sp. ctJ7x27 TaxID=2827835 RepID=A0A8S5S420_9CAUD|nr:MAG TPA: hypothetical protein [Siphoviridae sp. ctJ7x27]